MAWRKKTSNLTWGSAVAVAVNQSDADTHSKIQMSAKMKKCGIKLIFNQRKQSDQ